MLLRHKRFVYITPSPVLTRLKRLHNGMLGLMKMFGGMFVPGRIAAPNMTADQTFSQVDPGIAHLQAFFTTLAAWFHIADFIYV
jgi:hypothetical protein